MQWIKIFIGLTNLLLLLAGLSTWLAGWAAKSPGRKQVGSALLAAWLVYDLVGVILAFSFGWFA